MFFDYFVKIGYNIQGMGVIYEGDYMKIYLIILITVILSFSACFERTELPLTPATQQDASNSYSIVIDIQDGLITREDPVTPLSDSFTVVLASRPSSTVSIGTITSSDPNEVSVSPSSLEFTLTDWDTPQTVTVTGVDDGNPDGTQMVTINLGAVSSGDPVLDHPVQMKRLLFQVRGVVVMGERAQGSDRADQLVLPIYILDSHHLLLGMGE